MESTLTMGLKTRFINTCGCGAGFPWLLAHTTPTCTLGHPQLHGTATGMDIYIHHCDTGIRVHGYRMAVYTCMYTLDINTLISTCTTALWRQTRRWRYYYGSGRPLLYTWLNLRRWSAHCRGPEQYLATCVHRRQLWLPTVYGDGLRLV